MNKINPKVGMKMKRAKNNQDPLTGKKKTTEVAMMDIMVYFKAVISKNIWEWQILQRECIIKT